MTVRAIPDDTELSWGLHVQPTQFDAAARHGNGKTCPWGDKDDTR